MRVSRASICPRKDSKDWFSISFQLSGVGLRPSVNSRNPRAEGRKPIAGGIGTNFVNCYIYQNLRGVSIKY